MKVKKVNTVVSTGDKFIFNGVIYKVGNYKNGQISLHTPVTQFSQTTILVTTRKLNQMLKSAQLNFNQ